MTTLERLDFDLLPDDSPISVDSPWSTIGAIPDAEADAAIHGVRGCRWVSTSASGRIQYDSGSNQTAARYWSQYFRVTSFSSVNHYIASVYSLATGGSIQGDWRINTGRTVSIRNGTTAVATSSDTLTTGTVYRSEWKLDPATSSQELRIYPGESATPYITLTGAWTSASTRVFAFGPYLSAADGTIEYDTVKYADDWPGSEAPPVELTPVLRRYYFHNGQWV